MSVNGIGGSGGPGSVNEPKGPGGTGRPISPPPGGDFKASGGPKKQDLITSKLMTIINAEPEIRSDLVAEYKNLIKSGEYKMEAEDLASRILSDSLKELKLSQHA